MKIKEASEETGLSPDMIRYYEKMGLVRPQRRQNRYRDYTEDELFMLILVKYLSNLGVPLKSIAGAFESGSPEGIQENLNLELSRLMQLKEQIDARIAASRDSISCFEQMKIGEKAESYIGRTRYLLPLTEDEPKNAEIQRKISEKGYFFQFYYRQRFSMEKGIHAVGEADRGLLLYDRIPDVEMIPAQRCMRKIIRHEPGRMLGEKDLEAAVLEAAEMSGQETFTVLIHQLFVKNNTEKPVVVCVEILMGGEK